MPLRLNDYLSKLPPQQQAAVRDRAAELIEEEMTLRDLRRAREQSQRQMAEKLGIQQAAVSKLEHRTDMYISTLRDLIHAMGGELDVIARFPDKRPIRITQFSKLAEDAE